MFTNGMTPPGPTGVAMGQMPAGGMPGAAPAPAAGGQPNFAAALPQLMSMMQDPAKKEQALNALAMRMPAPPPHIMQQLPTGSLGNMMNPAGTPPAQPAMMPAQPPAGMAGPGGAAPRFAGNPFGGLR